jgi:hypothetical protein
MRALLSSMKTPLHPWIGAQDVKLAKYLPFSSLLKLY